MHSHRKKYILNHQEIQHKIKRIAYQIYESNVMKKKLLLLVLKEMVIFCKKIRKP